jgi:N-acetylneuraminic acid mutarotase
VDGEGLSAYPPALDERCWSDQWQIYLSGGLSGRKSYRDELYMYDPATNTWASKQPLPITGYWGATGVIDNKLYVVTSCRWQEDCLYYGDYMLPSGHPDRWLFRYDPLTDTWTELAIPPSGTGGHVTMGIGGTIGKKLYVGIGESNILQVYDPVTNTWVEKATPRALRSGGAFATLGARLYMAGGIRWNADGTYSEVRATNVYDPATNTWTNKAPLPTPRAWTAASRVVVNGQPRIAVVGGPRPGNNLQYIP